LHTYFDVSSLENITIEGPFSGSDCLDRLQVSLSENKIKDKRVCLSVCLFVFFSILVVSCVIWSGVLDSCGFLQSYSITSLA